MTNVNDNVRISDNIGVVASSSSKQLSSIRTLSLPFFILNILFLIQKRQSTYSKWAKTHILKRCKRSNMIIINLFKIGKTCRTKLKWKNKLFSYYETYFARCNKNSRFETKLVQFTFSRFKMKCQNKRPWNIQ
jgi:hypothetical protein